jgi:polysaccharide chain length determinant protein (PEP-CTERM system associated)
MQEDVQSGSALEMVRAIWSRRKWLGILAFLVPMTAVVSLAVFLPGLYRSTVTVLVERQQVPENYVQATVTSALETRLHTISQEILSRPRLEALINRFGLYTDLKKRVSPEEVIERMRSDISLEIKSGNTGGNPSGVTYAFALSYKGPSPQTVATVANTLASFYIEENLKVREKAASGTAQFLKIQLDEVKKRLDSQEAKVSEFKRRYPGGLPQQVEGNLATLERLNTQLVLNSDNQQRLHDRRDRMAKQLADAQAAGMGGGREPTLARIAQLNQELRQLRSQYSDKYPDVIRLRAEIAQLERELTEERPAPAPAPKSASTAAVIDPNVYRLQQGLAELDAEVTYLKSEEKRLRTAIASYVGRVDLGPQREQEFKELSRDYETTREVYATLLKRYEESQIAESMEQRQKGEQFRIIDPAVASDTPAAPNRLRLMIMGLALSLAAAAGAVVLAEQLNTSFHSLDDLRGFTTVPVLLSISEIVTPVDAGRRQRRLQLATAASVFGVLAVIGVSYYVAHGNEQLVWLLSRGRS